MSIASELASLRALARRLSEPWPAEERLASASHRADGMAELARRSYPHGERARDGFWLHRRSRPGEEWRGPVWRGHTPASRVVRQEHARAAYAPRPPSSSPYLPNPRSWMPSIARLGPVVLRFAAEVESSDVEEWRTYEAIRASLKWEGGILRSLEWARSVPIAHLDEAETALRAARTEAPPQVNLDAFARAVADRLAPQPRRLPATVKHIGALPRDWRGMRLRRRWRAGGPAPHVPMRHGNRTTLGTLAARYIPRRSDGSYNRHDARRWMRRFAAEALVASDALQLGRRLVAIEVLCRVVGLEDALQLTARPERPRSLADYVNVTIEREVASAPADFATQIAGALAGPVTTPYTHNGIALIGRAFAAAQAAVEMTPDEVRAAMTPSPEYREALAAFDDLSAARPATLAERERTRNWYESQYMQRPVPRRVLEAHEDRATLSGCLLAAVLAVPGVTRADAEEVRPGLVRVRHEGTADEEAVFDAAEMAASAGVSVMVERDGDAVPLFGVGSRTVAEMQRIMALQDRANAIVNGVSLDGISAAAVNASRVAIEEAIAPVPDVRLHRLEAEPGYRRTVLHVHVRTLRHASEATAVARAVHARVAPLAPDADVEVHVEWLARLGPMMVNLHRPGA